MSKNFKKYSPFLIIVIFMGALLWLSPFSNDTSGLKAQQKEEELLEGTVTNSVNKNENIQEVEILITKGSLKDQKITVENDNSYIVNTREFNKGDGVIVTYKKLANGENSFYIVDYLRTKPLLWLFIIFIVVVVFVTRWQGIGSLLGMLFSFIILFKIILPKILIGANPVVMAIIGAALIIPITFYLSHGINRKTTIAMIGTLLTLIITSLIAYVFADWGNLTGFASEEASYLQLGTAKNIDFKSLVLAGIIISLMGILDDVTISQTSIVQQLKAAKEKISFFELYKRATIVGRDHIASIVNTLILIYAGASLPLLLLLLDYSESLGTVINYEFMAEEIIQTLVASIGLILAIPITTLLACLTIGKAKAPPEGFHHTH